MSLLCLHVVSLPPSGQKDCWYCLKCFFYKLYKKRAIFDLIFIIFNSTSTGVIADPTVDEQFVPSISLNVSYSNNIDQLCLNHAVQQHLVWRSDNDKEEIKSWQLWLMRASMCLCPEFLLHIFQTVNLQSNHRGLTDRRICSSSELIQLCLKVLFK